MDPENAQCFCSSNKDNNDRCVEELIIAARAIFKYATFSSSFLASLLLKIFLTLGTQTLAGRNNKGRL